MRDRRENERLIKAWSALSVEISWGCALLMLYTWRLVSHKNKTAEVVIKKKREIFIFCWCDSFRYGSIRQPHRVGRRAGICCCVEEHYLHRLLVILTTFCHTFWLLMVVGDDLWTSTSSPAAQHMLIRSSVRSGGIPDRPVMSSSCDNGSPSKSCWQFVIWWPTLITLCCVHITMGIAQAVMGVLAWPMPFSPLLDHYADCYRDCVSLYEQCSDIPQCFLTFFNPLHYWWVFFFIPILYVA